MNTGLPVPLGRNAYSQCALSVLTDGEQVRKRASRIREHTACSARSLGPQCKGGSSSAEALSSLHGEAG